MRARSTGMDMIKDKLRELYWESYWGQLLLSGPRALFLWFLRHYPYFVPDDVFVRWQFRKAFGREPDLDNPRTLNEKIQWLKLHDRTALHTKCADKYAVRKYVADKVGEEYLVPLLYTTREADDLVPSNLPETPFIIKTTHASYGGVIVRDKAEIDWGAVRKQFRKWLNCNYYYVSKEWPYKNIKPGISIEALLQDERGNIPFDYKIHYFNGKPRFIRVDIDRFGDHKHNFYDTRWELQPFLWCPWENGHPRWPNGEAVEKPSQLELMLKVGKQLAEPFIYARVDLYEVEGKVKFGEITFYPGSGKSIISPYSWDRKLGDMLHLPN